MANSGHGALPPELITVGDWLRHAATTFARAELHYGHGTMAAWDEAVALVLGWLRIPEDRAEALLGAHLTAAECAALAECVRKRVEERVPVPYLTGQAHFGGLLFEVDSRVLIPRSPMAELLQDGLQPWLGQRLPQRILDLGTGSGCIGILAAMVFPEAEVLLADVSLDALDVASRNIRLHGLEDRVETRQSDLFSGCITERFDLILCNPPYVDTADLASMPMEFQHEPRSALAGGGSDGLELVQRLLRSAAVHLADGGLLVLEVGNSAPALLERWPALEWIWPELEAGGFGVGLIEQAALARAVNEDGPKG
ncbi:MAG: 50S ribosomal protein L3 N(5)-glutamine methyltransferase [Gammaproteobacteria bacterium]|nr:MAG: 50S ribosomal protein L3 N(5)-glutamine methyltransferase [Gammaproteobacteria bacterium]